LGDDAPCKIVGMGKVQIKKKMETNGFEIGKTCSISKEKSNFNREVGK
jgi:hypothetical protein